MVLRVAQDFREGIMNEHREAEKTKKAYEKPLLTRWGKLTDVTANESGSNNNAG